MRGRVVPLLAVPVLLALAFGASPASASQPAIASAPVAATSPAAGRLDVDVRVTRFLQRNGKVRARGVVTATLQGAGATPTTVRQRVLLQVRPGATCQILVLTLDQLNLVLLGVTVHLDRVELRVTGRRAGGVLGQLFCSLANSRVTGARAAAVRSLNHGLHGRSMHVMRFGVPLNGRAAQALPAGTCSILDLVLGPLHLDLLGLVVDLNRVHLSITGNPAGGILGRLLCGLSNTPTPPVPAVPGATPPALPAVPGV
jgi:hypothetical protein